MESVNIKQRRRLRRMLLIVLIFFIFFVIRVGFIQFVQGEKLQQGAYDQQTLDRAINAKRGTIYDATGKSILAISASVETVTVNPTNIPKDKKEPLAKFLSETYDLDYESTLKKINKKSSIETIVRKIEKEEADKLRVWLEDNNITTGVNIDEDTKRYYPNNELASQIIGFCGSDNQGLNGIEAKFDKLLVGEKGKISRATDAKGAELEGTSEKYVASKNGKDLILSIDWSIQSIVEKYLKQACIDNECTDGGNIIVMNPKTGDVLAMATYPNYNLNSPYEPNTEELKSVWDSLSKDEKNNSLQKMWRNKAIADSYEPGSTFKLITASAALEEGITTTDKEGEFNCTGSIEVGGVKIKCWRYYRPHGAQSLREGLMNSCNPVFIGLGQKLGKDKYYEYLEKFGLLSKTEIDLPGEANSIFLDKAKVGPVELGTISFGQRFEITPIQLITAVSAIANKGIMNEPRIVKKSIDTETGEIEEYPVVEKGRVISEKTANDVLNMMESVVAQGTGKNAQVKGYTVGGKTGTSEDGVNTNKYVTSFIGVTPISDPELVILITLYNPTGEGGHQGGGVAAPIASQVLTDILAYMEVEKDNEEEVIENVEIPEVRDLTLDEAIKLLKENDLEYKLNVEEKDIDKKEVIIENQFPLPGIKVIKGSTIELEIK